MATKLTTTHKTLWVEPPIQELQIMSVNLSPRPPRSF